MTLPWLPFEIFVFICGRPSAPQMSLPEPYYVVDYGDLRSKGEGPELTITAKWIRGEILVKASIENRGFSDISVPPLNHMDFDFNFWAESGQGKPVRFDAYTERHRVQEFNLELNELNTLPPANSISVNLGIPNAFIPETAKRVIVRAHFYRCYNGTHGPTAFELTSKQTILEGFPPKGSHENKRHP